MLVYQRVYTLVMENSNTTVVWLKNSFKLQNVGTKKQKTVDPFSGKKQVVKENHESTLNHFCVIFRGSISGIFAAELEDDPVAILIRSAGSILDFL